MYFFSVKLGNFIAEVFPALLCICGAHGFTFILRHDDEELSLGNSLNKHLLRMFENFSNDFPFIDVDFQECTLQFR